MIPLPEDFYIRAQAMLQGDSRILHEARKLRSWQNPNWTQHWHKQANANLELAEKSVLNDDRVSLYKRASALYALACYPYLQELKTDASYRGLKDSYKKRCLAEGYPVKYRSLIFLQYDIPYTFRKGNPRNHKGQCILFIRGLDSYKEVSYWDESHLLSMGYDIAAIDFPGMGENPVPMSLQSNLVFESLCQKILDDQDYSGRSIILWGLGFGGYWATKLLNTDYVLAAINQGGPIHYSFKPRLKRLLFHFQEIRFLRAMIEHGLQKTTSVKRFISGLSLLNNQDWTKGTAKLLYVNGGQDKTVSDREARVLEQLLDHDRLETFFIKDAGHLAVDVIDSQVLPAVLRWLLDINNNSIAA
ncbi:alpha/beta hydrolase [Bermanella marisrubri]|uniref:AB hydrolase-1 domain-containing protein n=1 Tax=Bermanella marisrubri TaxID=207949 RepID=Q1MY53_9GAMM|nr:alpha/beta hydrolase [Bermanella marisrubri]EAT10907.1 hypothetical protein RED65_12690 [Oceanobacter sp. RED65] [Bermanella marisrubri]QIZ85326.1 alpha/beta hydrolase [Bermanella marisrubri]